MIVVLDIGTHFTEIFTMYLQNTNVSESAGFHVG